MPFTRESGSRGTVEFEPEANPLKDWMQSLDSLLELPPDILVLPAHNLPFYGVRERLRGFPRS